jgi:putative ABC transport system ATP-binding protein
MAGCVRLHRDGDRRFRLVVEALAIRPGDRIAIAGPSGSGKSTLLSLISLVMRPTTATRFMVSDGVGSRDVGRLWTANDDAALTRLRAGLFGFVPQSGGLLPFLDVAGNIALTQRLAGRRDPDRVAALAERLGIVKLLHARPSALSMGQRQRVAIARALAHRPSIIVADEPTAALDMVTAHRAMALLAEETEHAGAALVVATHDLSLISEHGFSLWNAQSREGEGETVAAFAPAEAI